MKLPRWGYADYCFAVLFEVHDFRLRRPSKSVPVSAGVLLNQVDLAVLELVQPVTLALIKDRVQIGREHLVRDRHLKGNTCSGRLPGKS
jgi:hypothetical protein